MVQQDTRTEYASIKVSRATWAELNRQRSAPGESMDQVIRRLLERREGAGADEVRNGDLASG